MLKTVFGLWCHWCVGKQFVLRYIGMCQWPTSHRVLIIVCSTEQCVSYKGKSAGLFGSDVSNTFLYNPLSNIVVQCSQTIRHFLLHSLFQWCSMQGDVSHLGWGLTPVHLEWVISICFSGESVITLFFLHTLSCIGTSEAIRNQFLSLVVRNALQVLNMADCVVCDFYL